MCIIAFNPSQYSFLLILILFISSLIMAAIASKLNFIQYRFFLLISIIILNFSGIFGKVSFYIGFSLGIIFIILAVMNGVLKKIAG